MQFDGLEDLTDDLTERLSSWRKSAHGTDIRLPAPEREPGINEQEVRTRQRRIGSMSLSTLKLHAAFFAELEAFVRQMGRSPDLQSQVEDWAAFVLGVYGQANARLLERGIQQESDGLPKEIIETVTIPAPPPPKSWFQRMLGG